MDRDPTKRTGKAGNLQARKPLGVDAPRSQSPQNLRLPCVAFGVMMLLRLSVNGFKWVFRASVKLYRYQI